MDQKSQRPSGAVRIVIEDPDGKLHGKLEPGSVIWSADASRVRPQDCTPRQRQILFPLR